MTASSSAASSPVPVQNWVTINGTTIHQNQLVVRNVGGDGTGPVEMWVVTQLSVEGDTGACVVEMADLEFNFRVTVSCESFHTDGFEAATAMDGTPVWGY